MIQLSITPNQKRSTEAMRSKRKRYANRKRKHLVEQYKVQEAANIQPLVTKVEASGYSHHYDSKFEKSSVCESLCTR